MDFDYPADRNIIGFSLVKIGEMFGDVMKDLRRYLENSQLEYQVKYVGGFGSAYLYICTKT